MFVPQTHRVEQCGYTIGVSESTVLHETKRGRMQAEGLNWLRDNPEATTDDIAVRMVIYPDLVSCSVISNGTGEPIALGLDEFCSLPGSLLSVWSEAVYTLNPHWLDDKKPMEEKKIVIEKSPGVLSTSSARPERRKRNR